MTQVDDLTMEAGDDAERACDVCGAPAVVVIETVAWCDGCFHEMGSCCADDEAACHE